MARGRRRTAATSPSPRSWASAWLPAVTSDIEEDATRAGGDCGELNIAINPWTGYVANAT